MFPSIKQIVVQNNLIDTIKDVVRLKGPRSELVKIMSWLLPHYGFGLNIFY